MTKTCTACHQDVPLRDFAPAPHHKDGHASQCRPCRQAYRSAKRAVKRAERAAELAAIDANPLKVCTVCKKAQPRTSFHNAQKFRDGLYPQCKTCKGEQDSVYRGAHREENIAYQKDWWVRNRARVLTTKNVEHIDPETTFKTCITCGISQVLTAFSKQHNSDDGRRSDCRACKAATYQAEKATEEGRAKIVERSRRSGIAYRLNHPDRVAKTLQRWNEANPGKSRLYYSRRKARKQGLPDTLTAEQITFCYQYWGSACAICGKEEGLFRLTISLDHWIPISNPSCPGTVATNMVPMCHGKDGCNNSKYNTPPREWLKRRFGPRKAAAIVRKVEAYFAVVAERLGAPPSVAQGEQP